MPDTGLTVLPNADALARDAAARILTGVTRSSDRCAVCLNGGTTPERVYRVLATAPYRDALPWDRVHWFWGDERFVPHHDRRSNSGNARRLLLDQVPAPRTHIHAIPTDVADEDEAARAYEAELRCFYGAERLDRERPLFDVVLMGMGADGHTASLFPGSPALGEVSRWVVGIAQAGAEPFVPRVTLTFPALASTREMVFLVSGSGKRDILRRALWGDDLPATRAYSRGALVWLADRDAAPEPGHVA